MSVSGVGDGIISRIYAERNCIRGERSDDINYAIFVMARQPQSYYFPGIIYIRFAPLEIYFTSLLRETISPHSHESQHVQAVLSSREERIWVLDLA